MHVRLRTTRARIRDAFGPRKHQQAENTANDELKYVTDRIREISAMPKDSRPDTSIEFPLKREVTLPEAVDTLMAEEDRVHRTAREIMEAAVIQPGQFESTRTMRDVAEQRAIE